MKYSFVPEKMRASRPFQSAEFDYLVKRARECLLWRMSPDYYDQMTQIEYTAWHQAWQEIIDERSAD